MGAAGMGKRAPEPRHADEALRLAALVDAADDPIIGLTPEGIVTSWNGAAERLYGWTSEEIVGREITLIVPPDPSARRGRLLDRVRAGQVVRQHETVRMAKDGQLIDVSISMSPIRDERGTV